MYLGTSFGILDTKGGDFFIKPIHLKLDLPLFLLLLTSPSIIVFYCESWLLMMAGTLLAFI